MYVLGIETSCDETAASVVKDGRVVLSNIVSSSIKFHKKYGGIVPEIAMRKHLEVIAQVTDAGLKEAAIKADDLHLVSVTKGPGLLGALLVGVSFAKAMSFGLGIPLVGIDHIYAHIYASFFYQKSRIPLPCVALIVSGGHTSLFYVEDFDAIELLGYTQDDACGEAFDKVAKILGLGYPGGPLIEKLAGKGEPKKIRFHCSGTQNPFNFSFSGIKTAVLYYVKKQPIDRGLMCDIAASFQETVIDTLINKSLLACRLKKVNTLVVGGGVASNGRLREKFFQEMAKNNIKVFFPAKELCTDNAAMVAGLGYCVFKKGYRSGLDLNVD